MSAEPLESPLERFSRLPREERDVLIAEEARKHDLRPDELKAMLLRSWRFTGRPKQQAPPGAWTYWFLNCGRGFGKTITGAQWVKEKSVARRCRIGVIAPTLGDVRATCFEGEALALDTLVPTPSGYTTMGALRDGDVVIGGDGKPCRVIHAHPILYDRDCYIVRLRGGVEITADARHRWLTEDAADREAQRRSGRVPRPKVVTTEGMIATLRPTSGRSRANHAIRVSAASYTRADLPIDPYVFGAWLGDGLSKSGAICDPEGDVVAEIRRAGYTTRYQPSSSTVPIYGILRLQAELRELGVLRNKHVPDIYLRADADQRLALVQGLMDTDGYVSERGQCEFVSVRPQLSEALVDLLCSLGVKASAPRAKKTRVGTTHWIVKFTTTLPVFRMARKLGRLPATYRDADHWRVLSIIPTASIPVRCITVDSPDRTYLVTRHHVRTHNTGLLSVFPNDALLGQSREIAWNKTLLELTLANGSTMKGFGTEAPDRLRGPQHDYVWGEEVSSWGDAKSGDTLNTSFNNMKLGLRLGAYPQAVLTSTPKPNKLTRELLDLAETGTLVLTTGSSFENRANLSESWWRSVVVPLIGTRTGRQEIEAEFLEDVEGALWSRAVLDASRVAMPPGWQDDPAVREEWLRKMSRIAIGLDPNTTAGESADAAGIVVVGLGFADRHGYALDDRTTVRGGPRAWAAAAVDAYHDWKADAIVAETNNGGDMVEMVIHGFDSTVRVEKVSASRGKLTRAEPVAALYVADEEHEKVATMHHVGVFPELEDEQTTWVPGEESPNRMDALVWGAWFLRLWKPPGAGRGSHVARGDIPGITEIGAGLSDY